MMIRHRSATALALVAAACTWPTPLYANQNQTNFEQEIDAVCEEIFQNEDEVCFTRSEPASTSTEQITPDEQPALYTSLVQISHNQINSIKHHVTGQRRQSLGEGLAVHDPKLTGYIGGAAGAEWIPGTRISAFFSGSKVDGDQDSTGFETGYDLATDHYTFGIDLQVNAEWLVGIAYGATETELEYSSDYQDRSDNDSDHYLIYSSWYRKNFALDMTLGYSSGEFETRRQLPDAVATGTTDNSMIYLSVGGAYDFSQGGWTYGPLATLDYLDGEIDAFAEQGESNWNAQYDQQEVNSLIYTLGAQTSYAHSLSWGVILPYAKAVWRYEFEDERDLIVGRFAINPSEEFTIIADQPDVSWYEVSAGLSAVFPHGFAAFIHYEEVLRYNDTKLATLSAGARLEF
ncbi:MAG: hypothetical protein CMK83_14665 [Pseudomonadales bacterium]|jgi:outer membrane lipase/esterase|nr:hypothetical protein [Pseudomonadales bacterium]MEC8811160.1 autotransporter outer membrane beta-barrel domain-containing protein [Pseudomonadota bacterium]TNC90204.1 MAG: hypothetical protein CSH49_03980 [Alcanivorax sp.]HAG92716.1 hypothetical protein [Gammaproteobacteria bacterium]MBI25836.1 hypothetical protein [Pseudomonadales bacterium]|tara:strand:- start:3736 stop:4944 length:1209 start_codon:yes stop_codon:yes gene_type:complete